MLMVGFYTALSSYLKINPVKDKTYKINIWETGTARGFHHCVWLRLYMINKDQVPFTP